MPCFVTSSRGRRRMHFKMIEGTHMTFLSFGLLAALIVLSLFLAFRGERLRRYSPIGLLVARIAVVILALVVVLIFLPNFARS